MRATRLHDLVPALLILAATACSGAATPDASGDGSDAGAAADASNPEGGGPVGRDGGGSGSGSGSGGSSGSSSGSGSGSGSGSSSGSSGGSGSGSGSSSGGGSGSGSGGGSGSSSGGGSGDGGANQDCSQMPGLTWKTANETVFQSYPPAGSVECIQYSGCMYEGQFQDCSNTLPQSWVQTHNILSVFPDSNTLKYHNLCLKSKSGKTIVAVALDTCADSDCSGCCTQNKGKADELIDVEFYTDQRFTNLGINGGEPIQWADMGMANPSEYSGCN